MGGGVGLLKKYIFKVNLIVFRLGVSTCVHSNKPVTCLSCHLCARVAIEAMAAS